MNEIKKDLLLMSAKVREIEISVTDTKKSQNQLETSCQTISDMYDDLKRHKERQAEQISRQAEKISV